MKREEAMQILQLYKDELGQRIDKADAPDVKDVYQWQMDGFDMAIEALQAEPTHGRLIDADALMRSIRLDIPITGKENAETVANALNEIMAKIAGAPTVQADRPHGEWVDEHGNKVPRHEDGYPLGSCWCSQCYEWLVGSDEHATMGNFCPNCGADMRKEKE